jgi:tRNA nucleotidyltransferase (CCA-adding enzyme)
MVNNLNPLFMKALPVLKRIEDAGFEAYFVGGAVRDHLLKRTISDVDIASSATPDEIKGIFANTVDVGIEHGTVLVLFQGSTYEITTFRAEAEYKDYRRPNEVFFIRSLVEDLKRRDFTMNAMAMNKDGEIIDPFGGQQAISDKKIVTVGKAEERFSEDALRMMRAVRFVSQLDFTLDRHCYQALKQMGGLLTHIAVERKTAEFEKLLAGKNRNKAVEILCQTNLDRYLPMLDQYETRINRITEFQNIGLNNVEMWTLITITLKIEAKQLDYFLRSWKLPVKRIRDIQSNYHWTLFRFNNEWSSISQFHAGKEMIIHAEKVYNILNKRASSDKIEKLVHQYNLLPIKSRMELEVTGGELMELLNRPAGPWIKECLSLIETEILERRLENESGRIREWVLSCNQK